MRRMSMAFLVMVLWLLFVVPAFAGEEVAADGVSPLLTLTIQDVVIIAMSILGITTGLIGIVVGFVKAPAETRSLGRFDSDIQVYLDARRQQVEMMTTLENTVDKLGKHNREAIKEVAEVVLRAAQWIPGGAVESAARFAHEVSDGVPVASKGKVE